MEEIENKLSKVEKHTDKKIETKRTEVNDKCPKAYDDLKFICKDLEN